MFGIGSTELLVILLVALIVLGPKSLASVSRTLGKAFGEFRRVSTDFQRTLNMEAAAEEMRQAEQKRKNAEKAAASEPAATPGQEGASPASSASSSESPLNQAIEKAKEQAGKVGDSSPEDTSKTG